MTGSSLPNVVIVGAARTPMGGLMGALSSVSAPELGSCAIKAAVVRSTLQASDIDEVIMGCVLPAGLKQGPARQASLGAGLPEKTGCTTINKLCGSGMKATMFGFDSIRAGTNKVVVAGGMESMSNAPYIIDKVRQGLRIGHHEMKDHMFLDGLEDAYTGRLMGSFAQDTANQRNLSRELMDEFAISSLGKANAAIENGCFAEEIVAVPVAQRGSKEPVMVATDEQPGNARIEKIPTLRPAFSKDGTITAANASSISDGASALVLMNEAHAQQQGIQPLARMLAHSTHSRAPAEFTIAPIGAIKSLLSKVGWAVDDVDLFEINEAFAMVTQLATIDLGLDESKVNVHGGACALGHPVGSSGSRLIVTLIYALKQRNLKKGVAALCIGGGEATAVAIELI